MNFSEFTLYVMLIFLPGIIAYKVFEELTHQKDKKGYEVIISSLLFGFISYLFYYAFFKILYCFFDSEFPFHFLETLKDPKNIDYGEVFFVSCFAVLIGLILTVIDTYKILHSLARYFRITFKHGDLDTFTYLMHSNVGKEPWVIIRDMENNRAYNGWISKYSVGQEQNELFIRDVIVYENSTGTTIMTSPGIYLAKPKEKFIIEFPQLTYSARMDITIVRKVEEQWKTKVEQ
jgi:hypothetical protein